MNRNIILMLIGILFCSIVFTSCKTSEKNYRDAYMKAVEKRNEDYDAETLARLEREKFGAERVFGTDTVNVKTIGLVVDEQSKETKHSRYCVCVGVFEQVINARSMRNRLVNARHNEAFVGSAQKNYYVIVKSFADMRGAAFYANHATDSVKMKLPIKPFVICDYRIR